MIYPPVLRLLSIVAPDEFPFQPHWKMSETHQVFWTHCPTIDHLYPLARGGGHIESNWVTTSMNHNSAKGLRTLDEMGWTLHEAGDLQKWDGLSSLLFESRSKLPEDPYIEQWLNAYERARGNPADPIDI